MFGSLEKMGCSQIQPISEKDWQNKWSNFFPLVYGPTRQLPTFARGHEFMYNDIMFQI